MTPLEALGQKVDDLGQKLVAFMEQIRGEREDDRIEAARLSERVKTHDEKFMELARKNSPPPGSLRAGSPPFDLKKLGAAIGGVVFVLGGFATSIVNSIEAKAEVKAGRESAERALFEQMNEFRKTIMIVSRSAQSQAKSAEAMASPDPSVVAEAEREAVQVAQEAIAVEHELAKRQVKAAPSPADKQQAERSLADVRGRARKVGVDLE